ncbi:MAG: hypothetical protein IKZ46_13350 [Victivallales bacterium]|nr:hypothetical protein [Victivallales bacterium]
MHIGNLKRREFQRLPAARRFVTLRGSANNVMRKLEVHSLLARRFVTLRSSGNNVMRKLEVHRLLARRFECRFA